MFKTYAYFYISGFEVEPSEISRKLELSPTKTWLKGDEWLPNKSRENNNWEIHSSIDSSEMFLDKHIESVLDIIEPKRSQIFLLQKQGCDIGINCVGYYYGENSGFHLSATLLSRLAAFSMDIDFDLYCLLENERKSKDL